MIPHAISITASKGGSGKSSVAGALAGLAAASGWRVLLVDLDPQGNMARELGYMDQSDGGRRLFHAVVTDEALEPLRDVRPGLDVVPGGVFTRKMLTWLSGELREDPAVAHRLDAALASAASAADLVVFDTPPGEVALHTLVSASAHYFVIPTQGDAASNDGMADVLARIAAARSGPSPLNPALELLGVVVTFVPSGAKVIDRRIRAELRDLLGENVRIFEPSIRYAKQAAIDVRERGLGVAEYEVLAEKAKVASPWYASLRTNEPVVRFSSAAGGLAGDYQRLVDALLGAFTERQRELGYLT